MAVVNRSLPAVTASLGVLATPVVGTLSAALYTGEAIEVSVIVTMAMIPAGIAVGTFSWQPRTSGLQVAVSPNQPVLLAKPSLKSRWSDFSGCAGSLATPLYVPASTQRCEPQ